MGKLEVFFFGLCLKVVKQFPSLGP